MYLNTSWALSLLSCTFPRCLDQNRVRDSQVTCTTQVCSKNRARTSWTCLVPWCNSKTVHYAAFEKLTLRAIGSVHSTTSSSTWTGMMNNINHSSLLILPTAKAPADLLKRCLLKINQKNWTNHKKSITFLYRWKLQFINIYMDHMYTCHLCP